jgi:hypothetical protein
MLAPSRASTRLTAAFAGNAADNQSHAPEVHMAARKSPSKSGSKKKKSAKPVARVKKTVKKAATGARKVAKKASKAAHTATKRAATVGSTLQRVGRIIETGAAAAESTLNAIEKKRPAARKKS